MGFALPGITSARRGTRLTGAVGAAIALAVLTACGAPPQPTPPPGQAATLSADVFAYDHLDFRTNRKPLLAPDNECAALTPDVLGKLGFQFTGTYKPIQGLSTTANTVPGCDIPVADTPTYKISAATAPFQDYWTSRVTGQQAPGSFYTGLLAEKRVVISDRYYAVDYLVGQLSSGANSYSFADCVTTVDTGSANPLVVSYDVPQGGGPGASAASLFRGECPKTHQLAEKVLAELDKDGGSRVG